jgi:hypothetical protein
MLIPALIAYLLFPDETTHLVAQPASEAGPWLTALNLGLAGIGLWAFATGRIVAQGTYAKSEEKLAAAEAELRRRSEEDRTTLIPALVRSTDILAKQLERRDHTPPPPSKREAR